MCDKECVKKEATLIPYDLHSHTEMSLNQDKDDTQADPLADKNIPDPKKKTKGKKTSKGKKIVEDANGEETIVEEKDKMDSESSDKKKKKKDEDEEFEQEAEEKKTKKNISRSTRAGLTFPVGRVNRFMRKRDSKARIGSGAPIYMAAVLEYLTAEIIEIAGRVTKEEKKQRITPTHIKRAIADDEEIGRLCAGTITRETRMLNPLTFYNYNVKGEVIEGSTAKMSKEEAARKKDEIIGLMNEHEALNAIVKKRATYNVIKRLRQKEKEKGKK